MGCRQGLARSVDDGAEEGEGGPALTCMDLGSTVLAGELTFRVLSAALLAIGCFFLNFLLGLGLASCGGRAGNPSCVHGTRRHGSSDGRTQGRRPSLPAALREWKGQQQGRACSARWGSRSLTRGVLLPEMGLPGSSAVSWKRTRPRLRREEPKGLSGGNERRDVRPSGWEGEGSGGRKGRFACHLPAVLLWLCCSGTWILGSCCSDSISSRRQKPATRAFPIPQV